MSNLPTLCPSRSILLKPALLTPEAFQPFGTVIVPPLTQDITHYPETIPEPVHPNHQPRPVSANQSTALKTSPISSLTNDYPQSASNPSYGLQSIFSCFPRQNTYTVSTSSDGTAHHHDSPDLTESSPRLKLGILERHPYTTQTFCPFNLSNPHVDSRGNLAAASSSSSTAPRVSSNDSEGSDRTHMLVIVAPTLSDTSAKPVNPPDLENIRAFYYPITSHTLDQSGYLTPAHNPSNVAVTYNPGTWHAPMIVLGSRRVDFLVTQFANGIGEDDCQEVIIGSGPDERMLSKKERESKGKDRSEGKKEIEVQLGFTGHGLWRDTGIRGNVTSQTVDERLKPKL